MEKICQSFGGNCLWTATLQHKDVDNFLVSAHLFIIFICNATSLHPKQQLSHLIQQSSNRNLNGASQLFLFFFFFTKLRLYELLSKSNSRAKPQRPTFPHSFLGCISSRHPGRCESPVKRCNHEQKPQACDSMLVQTCSDSATEWKNRGCLLNAVTPTCNWFNSSISLLLPWF